MWERALRERALWRAVSQRVLSERADAVVGGIDVARIAFGFAPRPGRGAIWVMLRDQAPPGESDLRIAGRLGDAEHPVGVIPALAEPSRVDGVADQQAEQRAKQRIGSQQHAARDDADQLAVPTLRGCVALHRGSLQAAAECRPLPPLHYSAIGTLLDRAWRIRPRVPM